MQILLQQFAEHWPVMAGALSPAQRREVEEILRFLPAVLPTLWSFGFAGITTTYLTVCQYLDKSEAAIAFFAVFLISLGICLNVYENHNRSADLGAASVRAFKFDLRMQSPASGCLVVGLLLVLMLFTRFVWLHAVGHQVL
jgi:hypothetical protein